MNEAKSQPSIGVYFVSTNIAFTIHGYFCKVITEMANTSGRDYVKQYDIRTKERVKIARDLARGNLPINVLHATATVPVGPNARNIMVFM